MGSVIAAGDALRYLADGRHRARDVAGAVGWNVRTGGPRMHALERQGYVERVVVRKPTTRTVAPHEWRLTEKGRRFLG